MQANQPLRSTKVRNRLSVEDAAAHPLDHRAETIAHAEPFEYPTRVGLDRARRNVEAISDLRIAQAVAHEHEHLVLARRELRAVSVMASDDLATYDGLRLVAEDRAAGGDPEHCVTDDVPVGALREVRARTRSNRLERQVLTDPLGQHHDACGQPVLADRCQNAQHVELSVDDCDIRRQASDGTENGDGVIDLGDEAKARVLAHRPRQAVTKQRLLVRDQHAHLSVLPMWHRLADGTYTASNDPETALPDRSPRESVDSPATDRFDH
jgi:hypothetical protein